MTLDELERLYSGATQGHWGCDVDYTSDGIRSMGPTLDSDDVTGAETDAALIAAMHEALPLLLRVARATREELDAWERARMAYDDDGLVHIDAKAELQDALSDLAAWEAGR